MISLCINTHIQVSHMMLYYTTMTVQSQCMGLGLNTLKKLRRKDLFFHSCCRVLRFFTAIGSNYVTCNNVYELFVGIERVCQHTVKWKCYANYNFNWVSAVFDSCSTSDAKICVSEERKTSAKHPHCATVQQLLELTYWSTVIDGFKRPTPSSWHTCTDP